MRPMPSTLTSRGYSLIELLVSMVIALLVLAGVINSYLASRTAFRFNEELAFIQENARYATEYLSREIRGAGYYGCDQRNAITVNAVSDDIDGLVNTRGLEGFEGGGASTFPDAFSADVRAGTDAVIVRQADQDNAFAVQNHTPASAQINIVGQHNFDPGTVFVISDADCSHQGIFDMNNPSNPGPDGNVVHNTGAGNSYNCTRFIRGTGTDDTNGDGYFDCDDCGASSCDWADTSTGYGPGSMLFALSAKAFYISASSADPTVPALYVQSIRNGGESPKEELVSGIEDFQLTYGVDTNDDGQPNRYFTAQTVQAANNWDKVVAVRVQMVVRSRNPALEQAEARTLLDVPYNDRFLRQLITTTIRVRNYLG